MQINEAFLDQLIKNHYKAAQEMMVAVIIHAALAVISFVALPGLLASANIPFKELAGILGGGLFAGLGLTPGKEILDRREKARNLEAVRPLLQALQQNPTEIDPDTQKQIKEVFLDLIEKTVAS